MDTDCERQKTTKRLFQKNCDRTVLHGLPTIPQNSTVLITPLKTVFIFPSFLSASRRYGLVNI
jgi:hypothetical protein